MKCIKATIVSLCALLICPVCWAQKKPILKAAAKAVASKPGLSISTTRPYAQLLADAQKHIETTGYLPRVYINDDRGIRIAAGNMTPTQLTEFRLANKIASTLSKFRMGELDSNDPDLTKLQQLIDAHPKPRIDLTEKLAQFRNQKREAKILEVYQKTLQYTTTYQASPRRSMRRNGHLLTLAQIKQNYPENYEEINLGMQIYRLIRWGNEHAPDHPKINALKDLVAQYPIKNINFTPQSLLNQLREFLAMHQNRWPRHHLDRRSRRYEKEIYTQEEKAELSLNRQLHNIINETKPIFPEQQAAVDEIKQLWEQYRIPSPEELLAQAQAWVAGHNGMRPRNMFVRDGVKLKVQELPTDKYKELLLARRMWRMVHETTENTPAIEGLKQLFKLPMRPQEADEFPSLKPSIQETEPYDDFEDYFNFRK